MKSWLAFWCAGLVCAGFAAAGGPPRRVLLVGDSLMQVPAHSMEQTLSRRPEVETRSFTRIGSGLARLDVYDWMERLRLLKEEFAPDTVLVFMGANDRQAMRAEGRILQPGDPAWEEEYAGRIGAAMDLLIGKDGARVLWMELPDMREASMQEDVDLINRIIAAEAEKRGPAVFFPTRPVLSRTPGRYSPYVIQANGMPLLVRSSDHIHLNRAGADLLARRAVDFLWNE